MLNSNFSSRYVANTRRHALTHSHTHTLTYAASSHPQAKHKADLFTLEHERKASVVVRASDETSTSVQLF